MGAHRRLTMRWRIIEEANRTLQKQIEDATIGGPRLEVLGLVWLTIGTICTGIPGELAWLIARVFGSV